MAGRPGAGHPFSPQWDGNVTAVIALEGCVQRARR